MKADRLKYRYAVYEANMLNENNEMSTSRFIVIKNEYNIIEFFTGLEKYSGKYTGRNRPIETRDKHELEYICKALNYILFSQHSRYNIDKVSRISKEMIFDFFEQYRTTRMDNGRFPGEQSVEKCISSITYFFCNIAFETSSLAAVKPDDLVIEEWYKRNVKSPKVVQNYTPIYKKKSIEKTKEPLLRDIPKNAVKMLIAEADVHDPDIAFAIVAESTTGMRPGEAMNMRREDSHLGPGIKIEYIGTRINRIEVDLTKEYLLRSDGKKTGEIKKERMVTIYKPFMGDFLNAYKKHMYLLEGREYETRYGPLFINRDGKAMTYKTYQQRFQSLVKDHLRPRLLESEDPLLQIFGQRLLTKNLSPHALRHHFTVMLSLNEDVSQIMFYRGDSSPVTALYYLQNKGELIKAAGLAHKDAIEGLIEIGRNITNE
jgi:integrase